MAAVSRREFVKKAATDSAIAGFLAAGIAELHANPLGLPIGSQTYPHRAMLKQDFPGLMKLDEVNGLLKREYTHIVWRSKIEARW